LLALQESWESEQGQILKHGLTGAEIVLQV